MARVVEFSAVSKRYRYRGPLVLDRISLQLEPGTLTRVQGENGSGKSTLLRIACGFSRPSQGGVRRGFGTLGFVPDRATPTPRMTARSYLAHLGRLAGSPARTTQAAAEAVTDRLGLAPGLDAPLGTLSRGNLRKVLLAQCLMRPVELAVLDEPFAALDAAACTELTALMRERVDQGGTFLVATHADTLGNLGRTLVLQAGRLSGTPEAASMRGPAGEPVFAIELDGPLPASALPGSPLPAGGTRYLVPSSQVEPFLQAAIFARSRVLRLNPVEPDEADRAGAGR